MMVSRPMNAMPPSGMPRGHSEAPMQFFQHPRTVGMERPIIRTASWTFRPRILPPVNVVRGSPRLYG